MERFLDSFERCLGKPEFLEVFYDRFLASSDEVAEKFRNTDFKRQRRMLKTSLIAMVAVLAKKSADLSELQSAASSHGPRGLDIRPQLYELWLDNLVLAVSTCDERYTHELGGLWREAMQPGIDYMTSTWANQ